MSRQSRKAKHLGALAPVCKLETPEYTGNQMSVHGGVFERQIILLPYRLPHVTATGYTVYLYVNI